MIGAILQRVRTAGGSVLLQQAKAFLRFWPLLFPALLLLPELGGFPYPESEAPFSDIVISHFSNAIFLKRSIFEGQGFPLWSPVIMSGAPFAANPLAGLMYPPGWLALLLPLPLGFNLLILLHLILGGAGLYRLLRREGLGRDAALLGGAAFAALPKLFAHYGAGHLTLLYAVPWTPWLLLSVKGWQIGSGQGQGRTEQSHLRPFPFYEQPSIFLALIFLADPRWAVYAGALWSVYALSHSQKRAAIKIWVFDLFRRLSLLMAQVFLAALLAAPLALPLMEFVRLSSRAALAAPEALIYSLPVERLLGLIFPDFGGFHEWTLYPGAAVLFLGLLAVVLPGARSRSGFWLWTAGFSLLFSLGEQVPGLPFLASLPGLNLLRVPSRALFLTGLSLVALAAFAADRIVLGISTWDRRRVNLLGTALAASALALAAGSWALLGRLPPHLGWGAMMVAAATLWTGFQTAGRLPAKVWSLGLLILCLLDWGAFDRATFSMRSAVRVMAEDEAAASFLDGQEGIFRVYSPSYSLSQATASLHGLELAYGVDPLQLQSTVRFMETASRVPSNGYSVALPPFSQGDPNRDNAAFLPDPARLGLLNVRYVAAEYDLRIEGLKLLAQFGETRIYENLFSQPRAWIQPVSSPVGSQKQQVDVIRLSPNQITVRAAWHGSGPQGLVVLSEIAYPGWRVWVDGTAAPVETVDGLLRGVRIPPGEHQVDFAFHPFSLYLGSSLSAAGLLWIAWRGWIHQHSVRRTAPVKGIGG